MEGEIFNPIHVKIPLKDQNTTTTASLSAQPTSESSKSTPVLSQSAKLTLPVPTTLDVAESSKPTPYTPAALGDPELAKLTLESAKSTPTVPGASEASSDDFAPTIATLVGMEVPEVLDEDMVDYEATSERTEVNVVYMSTDYYILGDDLAVAEFNS